MTSDFKYMCVCVSHNSLNDYLFVIWFYLEKKFCMFKDIPRTTSVDSKQHSLWMWQLQQLECCCSALVFFFSVKLVYKRRFYQWPQHYSCSVTKEKYLKGISKVLPFDTKHWDFFLSGFRSMTLDSWLHPMFTDIVIPWNWHAWDVFFCFSALEK